MITVYNMLNLDLKNAFQHLLTNLVFKYNNFLLISVKNVLAYLHYILF